MDPGMDWIFRTRNFQAFELGLGIFELEKSKWVDNFRKVTENSKILS